ncbi:MAG: radical SAM protein, partial [Clostridium sp.]
MNEITIELTNKCLNSCIHCSSVASEDCNMFIKLNDIKEVVEKYNPKQVNISGGEPLLHKDIKEILLYLKSKNIKIKLYTCGVIDGFKKILLEIHSLIDIIVFPFYSYNENIYNTITNNDLAYIYVTHAIKVAKKLNMNIEAHIVPMTINIDTLWETVDYL